MFVKREQADALYEKTSQKFSKLGNARNVIGLEKFEALLDNIAKTSNYKEGEMIMNADLKSINRLVRQCIDGFANNILESRDQMSADERNNFDCIEPLRTYTEHLFAMTMKKLGCPHMPALFGDEIQDHVNFYSCKLNDLMKQEDYYRVDVNEQHKKQRGKDAEEVRKENYEIMTSLQEKKGTLKDVTNLIAEYQALKLRQDNHGSVWKFFHKAENEARTQLLKDMEASVGKFFGFRFDLTKGTPTQYALSIENTRADIVFSKAYDDKALSKRYEMPEDAFGYEATDKTRAIEQRAKTNKLFNDPEKNMQAQIDRVYAEPEAGNIEDYRVPANIPADEVGDKATQVSVPSADAPVKSDFIKNK